MSRETVKHLARIAKQRYGVSVTRGERPGACVYQQTNGKMAIQMQRDLEDSLVPVLLAHEIGHCRDFYDNYNGFWMAWDRALDLLEERMEMERRAWLYAVDVLTEVEYADWNTFLDTCHQCLTSYKGLGVKENVDLLVWEVR